ncbi:MAG: hemerythrin domain-containing protein [Betaproteobacteria bacterium]
MARTKKTPMDAIALLKNDHRVVEGLFERFEKSHSKPTKEKLAKQICLELMVHASIEEEIFYPATKDVVDEELYAEAHVEHDGAKVLIAEILASSPDDGFYDAKVKVLSEMIKHHVKEEEQRDGLFAQAKKGDLDMDALGAAMAVRKQEIMRQFATDGVPAPETRAMKGVELRRGEPVEA